MARRIWRRRRPVSRGWERQGAVKALGERIAGKREWKTLSGPSPPSEQGTGRRHQGYNWESASLSQL